MAADRMSRLAIGWLAAVLAAAGLVWLGCATRADLRVLAHVPRLPVVLAVLAVIAITIAVMGVRAARVRHLPDVGDGELVLAAPHLPACRARPPVLIVGGLEPGAGASTITFNLAVLLATLGELHEDNRPHRPRPVCLLRAGALATTLGLDARPLEDRLVHSRSGLAQGLLPLAVRHPSGCELLCLSDRASAPEYLWALVNALRRQYDAVLIDAAVAGLTLANTAAEIAELLLLVGLSSPASVDGAGLLADQVWRIGLEQRTIAIVNRALVDQPTPPDLPAGFHWSTALPEERAIAAYDVRAIPWVLDGRLAVARQLVRVGRRLVPWLLSERLTDVA